MAKTSSIEKNKRRARLAKQYAPRRAKLRKIAAKDGPAIATLSWDVVRPLSNEGETQTKVRLKDGREGWLWAKEVRAPIDYRASIEKRKGKWMITAFVAGD